MYHTLLMRLPSEEWIIEFGSHDKKEIMAEIDNYKDTHNYRHAEFRIIDSDGEQKTIDRLVTQLLTRSEERRLRQIEEKYSTENGATEEERQEAQNIIEK